MLASLVLNGPRSRVIQRPVLWLHFRRADDSMPVGVALRVAWLKLSFAPPLLIALFLSLFCPTICAIPMRVVKADSDFSNGFCHAVSKGFAQSRSSSGLGDAPGP
jgi:hypothetical protein